VTATSAKSIKISVSLFGGRLMYKETLTENNTELANGVVLN
jgi:hypothetical protein